MKKWERILLTARRYLLLVGTIIFILSCNILLFLKTLQHTMNLQFTEEMIRPAAVYTFPNILFLSLIWVLLDYIRRQITVQKPLERISETSEKVMQGDLKVQIEKKLLFNYSDPTMDEVIDCFNRMIEELAGVETLRTDFIANVSHELKTPLAVINNYGTLLQQPNLPEEKRKEYAKAITEASRSLSSMVENILKLNKLENQNVYVDAKEYNLSEQLCECLLGFESVWEKKKLDIETDIEEEVYIHADPELLSLVWNNLFSNALKFTEQGSVKVSLHKVNNEAVVKVSDTGCGMDSATGKHIFEKFYQGDTSHATKGNGLGLALVKRVVDIMHGKIEVESEVGKGSTFTVRLESVNHEC